MRVEVVAVATTIWTRADVYLATLDIPKAAGYRSFGT